MAAFRFFLPLAVLLAGPLAARGASVYTLSAEAAAGATARLVERHDGGDLLAGLDLAGTGDGVAAALLDLARLKRDPASRRLAEVLGRAGAELNDHPLRQARLASPEGRAPLVAGIAGALAAWAAADAAGRL